jgi:hAT family C-terminal dimerisation region
MEYYNELTVDYVYELFEDSVQDDTNKNSTIKDLVHSESKIPAVITTGGNNRELNDQEKELFSFVRERVTIEKEIVNNSYENILRLKKDLRKKIKSSLKNYKVECRNMDMLQYLEENGNKLYKTMVANKKLEVDRILGNDALYVSKLFDATKWWQDHELKYPELTLAATILLGKPTHNAFQERVFSRGTYTDTKLRKRLREEFFEMSVLNAVNGKQIDEIYDLMKPTIIANETNRTEYMKEFLESRNNEPEIEDDGKPEAVPEYASVCSQRTSESMIDEDDDDWSIVMQAEK